MAQHYKGPRKQIKMPADAPASMLQVIANRAAASGTGASQYLADLLAFAVGRPDLARSLTQSAIDYPEQVLPDVVPAANMNPRVDLEVYELVHAAGVACGISKADYLLDVCMAHVADEPLPPLPIAEEELLLTG
ncbi:MAG: hypothetical protein AB7G47_20065 [Mycolicibacterium sp.]|uniref:hypothetical protein n=1 Tax=Mycolicibacterium sp. TaxID=2320850 RepID=UPI003D103BC0